MLLKTSKMFKVLALCMVGMFVMVPVESVSGEDPLVFITSFAKGETGAIHAMRLD
ncbi:MAG: hypothetical protein HN882_08080, partial [Planctomycetaceae bacterium]|nr:hypothetical protein [Planctomycetaceae bacterium]